MKSYELNEKLKEKIQIERTAINEVLKLIAIGLKHRSYLELGFGSMFDWLTKGFGYSGSAAQRRIEAARLLNSVPQVAEKLQSGELNLTTVAKAQSMIRAQEKLSGLKVEQSQKIDLLSQIENKSAQEAERICLAVFPEAASSVHQERRTVVNEYTTRHIMNLSLEVTADLDRAKEILSHKMPFAKDADVIAVALKYFLDRNDPLRKVAKKNHASETPNADCKDHGASSPNAPAKSAVQTEMPTSIETSALAGTSALTETSARAETSAQVILKKDQMSVEPKAALEAETFGSAAIERKATSRKNSEQSINCNETGAEVKTTAAGRIHTASATVVLKKTS